MSFVPNVTSGPPEGAALPPGPLLVPAGLRRSVSDYILPSYGPRSRVSYPWSLETPMLGYTAPRLPVYASIVNLGKEKNRCASYYASNMGVPAPEGSSASLRALPGGLSGQRLPGELDQGRDAAIQESQSHLSRPRSRRTVCVGQGFSLPPLLEEDASYGRCRSASVVMGTQAMTISSLKVNNIEKAERMKAHERRKDLVHKEDVEVLNNIENTQKVKALEISRDPLKSESDESDGKDVAPKAPEAKPSAARARKVSFSDGGAAVSPELTRPRVRLSYVEPSPCEEKADAKVQQSKRKRLSWAAGDKGHRPASRESRLDAPLNNKRDAEGRRSRLSAAEASTLYPRSEPSGDAPKCKKRLSWATSERKRFSWSPRSSSMDRGLDRRRFSIAGDESRRQSIRMGTRSLLSISSPVAGTLVHLAGEGVHQSSLLAAILDPDR